MKQKRMFVGLMGGVRQDETVTTLFRLSDAALARGHTVDIWCCGTATHLSAEILGETKPLDVTRLEQAEPAATTHALIARLGNRHGSAFRWFVCRYCAEENGAGVPGAPARLRPSVHFPKVMAEADLVLILGDK